jgi:class 3 adenylate cyclase
MGFPPGLVTLLFTDVEGSIRLWEADREAMAATSARYDCIVREQVKVAGGRVVKAVGEAFRAVFADPSAALAAAVAIQRAVGAEPWPSGSPVRVRMAVHSGACVERDGNYFGPVVNRVARLLDVGHGGQILLSGATYELLAGRLPGGIGFRDLGEHRLKDLGQPERVLQVTGPRLTGGFGALRSLDHPALRAAAFEAAYARGRALGQADAIALAMGTAQPDPGVAPAAAVPAAGHTADSSADPLSDREREIVALLAGGHPTPRSPGISTCRSTRCDRTWSGSGTRPAPGVARTWSATPSRPTSTQSRPPPDSWPPLA